MISKLHRSPKVSSPKAIGHQLWKEFTVRIALHRLDNAITIFQKKSGSIDQSFHDVDETRIVEVLPLVDHAQSTESFAAKVRLSKEKFGSVPKIYVRTALDKMVSPKLQDEMVGNWNVDAIHVLQAGHFPTLSMPDKLAELMLDKVLEPA